MAMNNSWCRLHKKTPYELVYGDKPHGNCILINDLFAKGICNEEEIPDTIDIQSDSITNLDEDMDGKFYFLFILFYFLFFIFILIIY